MMMIAPWPLQLPWVLHGRGKTIPPKSDLPQSDLVESSFDLAPLLSTASTHTALSTSGESPTAYMHQPAATPHTQALGMFWLSVSVGWGYHYVPNDEPYMPVDGKLC